MVIATSRNIERMAELEFTVRYQDAEDGWVTASVLEIPGVRTQGATQAEARENVLDALKLALEVQGELAAQAAENADGRIEHLAFALTT
jgi:predicted RNase H-like HicB family nuclease